MKLKKRLIISRVIVFAIAIVLIVAGIVGKNDMLKTMGIVMGAMSVVKSIQFTSLIKNKEKFDRYEKSYYDERNIFIARKSYSVAYWITIYSEVVAMIVLETAKKNDYAAMLGYIACFQLAAYVIANYIFRKKY